MLLSMADVQSCIANLLDVVLTNNRTSSNLLNIVYGLVQLKYVALKSKVHPITGHESPEGE